MDALVHRLENEIRELTQQPDKSVRGYLLSKLDDIRLSIARQDALRLEILIDKLAGK